MASGKNTSGASVKLYGGEIAFSRDLKYLARAAGVGLDHPLVELVDVATGKTVAENKPAGESSLGAAAFSPDGRILAAGGGTAEKPILLLFDILSEGDGQ